MSLILPSGNLLITIVRVNHSHIVLTKLGHSPRSRKRPLHHYFFCNKWSSIKQRKHLSVEEIILTFVVMDIVPILEYFSKLTGVLSKRLLEFFDEIVTADVDASLEWQVDRDFVRFKHVAEKILGLFRFFLRLNR